jgi:peptidoglycan/xylan/chitin deacetylase (PgdA/CDA1 family)
MILPAKTPAFVEYLFSNRIWRMPSDERTLYLTFDDGPHPRITNNVLDMLARYNAQATFFCIGHRVAEHPDTYARIINEGHAVGNHTHNHLNGWKTHDEMYLEDVRQASRHIDSKLFRPPYGRISNSQFKTISKMGLKTVMWTVLSGDYEKSLSKESCAKRVLSNISKGAIYLFHDSEKAEANMMHALSSLLEAGSAKGFRFNKIDQHSLLAS